ncbi:MAG TPA: T9SS type A sorting domain-containing protein [Chitinophagales bacterium]|nr:T9SS type A sorting domain-containing protein [Chitinophagales bacterium]
MKKIITLVLLALTGNTTFSQPGSQTFTSSGTFIVPAGVTSITIEVVGAGGNGGLNGGGGGGAGGYASGVYTVTPLDSLTVMVGVSGGGAGAGTTRVATLISASGGENGFSVANPYIGGGGTGGTGSGGTILNRTGGTGGGGYWTYFGGGGAGAAGATSDGANGGNTIVWNGSNCLTPGGTGGIGGGAPGGDGGKGAGFTDDNCSVTDPAAIGGNYGGGGGGGNGNGGAPKDGAGGYCLISWDEGTGINTIFSKDKAMIFPNLFNNKISIQYTNGNEDYELINPTGKIIWTGKHIEQKDFSELATGLYFLKVQNQCSMQTVKLIKQ